MIARRRSSGLRTWLILSVLLHVCLVLLPGRIFEIIFPPESPSPGEYGIADAWPGFSEVAFVVVSLPDRPAVPTQAQMVSEAEEEQSDFSAPGGAPSQDGGGLPSGGRQTGVPGSPTGHAEPLYFPPVPRLIIPPSLDDLGIASLEVNVRILVGADGIPEKVILDDTISDPDVRRRILDCARRFRFEPARVGDKPTSSWVDLPLALESAESR